MFGLILAVICMIIMLISGQAFPQAFLGATDFLFWWYVVTSIISAVFMVLLALGLLGAGSVIGGLAKGVQGAVAGFFVGGALAVWAVIIFIVSCAMSIGGAYLLHSSVAINSAGIAQWNFPILIVGMFIIAIKVIWQMVESVSSKKDFDKQ
jgi:hypothetical protein